MRRSPLVPAAAVLLAFSLGCGLKPGKPNDAFLNQVKASLGSQEGPEFTVILDKVDGTIHESKNQKLKAQIMILANQMGFRVEASSTKPFASQPLTIPHFEIQSFKNPNLPGVTFQQDGQKVLIHPDYREEIIIESALPPLEGREEDLGRAKSSAQRAQAIAEAKILGVKDAEGAVDADIAANKELKKAKAKEFADNVDRIAKDNGYKRAWYITYRTRESTSIPKDSPFWALMDAWHDAGDSQIFVLLPTRSPLVFVGFFKTHGQVDMSASLQRYSVVAFEGQDGKLAKTEPWKTFEGK